MANCNSRAPSPVNGSHFSLADPAAVVDHPGANVHSGMVQPVKIVSAWLLARPILHEYDAFTMDEPGKNPAEFGNLAASATLWKSQKRVGGKPVRRLHGEVDIFARSIFSGVPFDFWKASI